MARVRKSFYRRFCRPIDAVCSSIIVVVGLLHCSLALARLPADYGAVVVFAPAAQSVRAFDLRAALAGAKVTGKPTLIYFGAFDCPYCKQLEGVLSANRAQLAPKFQRKYAIIEIDGWLRGAKMQFVLADGQYTLAELRTRLGDKNRAFYWPTWYAIDDQVKLMRELPPGANAFLDPDSIEDWFELNK